MRWQAGSVSTKRSTPRRLRSARPLRRDAQANQERLLAAAITAVLREGNQVPMATIAAEAGVGVGTLYRRYPNREALLDALTHRSFELLVEIAQMAEARPGTALAGLDWWWDHVIARRDELVLPLNGGPPVSNPETIAVRTQLHAALRRILERGRAEGSLRDDVNTGDVILFGAMLVTPPPGASNWDRAARRQKKIYVDGLASRN